jgi:HPt (histidine-containing phosphotransfer) domain-containing protein
MCVVNDRSPPATSTASPLDEAAAIEALGGDRELFVLLAKIFIDEGPKLLARLCDAVARGDGPAVQAAGHALKGTVRYFGQTDVYDLAYSLETQGRSGNLDRAQAALDGLAASVPRLSAALAACCVDARK